MLASGVVVTQNIISFFKIFIMNIVHRETLEYGYVRVVCWCCNARHATGDIVFAGIVNVASVCNVFYWR